MYKTVTLKANAKENRYFKKHLTPNMYKIITLKANAKEIIILNAFGTTYVQNHYFEGKCKKNHYFKMHVAPHMYKIITLKQMLRKSSL